MDSRSVKGEVAAGRLFEEFLSNFEANLKNDSNEHIATMLDRHFPNRNCTRSALAVKTEVMRRLLCDPADLMKNFEKIDPHDG